MYVCGITPYDAAHLGHIFTFLTYDLVQRRLEDLGHSVKLVRNVTDVDEPIFRKARANNEHYAELARRETAGFQDIMHTLNFRNPAAEPLASEYIAEMASAVEQLLTSDHAYRLDDDIYFDIATFPAFGTFSGFSEALQQAFMADRGGDPERPGKHQPLDFLLWRGITDPDDPAAWESPVGYGRPGWHIECSIMSSQLLGTPIDLHGGGMDLIFPHHECEIAQSESLGASPFTRNWVHVAPLLYHGEKMSKSLGNLVFARDLLADGAPAALRLALMNYHYRVGGEWRREWWQEAKVLTEAIRQSLIRENGKRTGLPAKVRALLDDNLDTPQMLAIIRDHVEVSGAAIELRETLQLLGIVI
jgi:L-cysteine:1D-myo-inositol 2-amino-2-deoxy-alpha-D-glucopyranoside ligase